MISRLLIHFQYVELVKFMEHKNCVNRVQEFAVEILRELNDK